MNAQPTEFEVLVVGGGLTGIVFALLLQSQVTGARRLPIGIVESGPAPSPAPPAELALRVVALSPASRAVLERCGAWAGLPAARIGPYRRMVVWHHDGEPGGRASITFDAAEQGVAELGYIVESDLVRSLLWQRATAIPGIELIAGASPVSLETGRDAMTLRLADGRTLGARLVVGADGHASWLREALGIPLGEHAYHQHALVAHVAGTRPHRQTAWQRFLPDGPLALLPLADGRCSIVWSCADRRAQELADASGHDFERAVTAASAGVLGDLSLTTRRLSFPLAAGHAARYTGLRFALIGDAAHRVHPLAGQGVNLGLLDAAVLAEVLADHLGAARADPGDPLALRRYERRRKGANLAALGMMDALHWMFTSELAGVARGAGAGLSLVNRLVPVKRRLADHALGRRGDLPRVIRPL
jgi:2-octaprenylphenol hydroxylase